MIFYTKNIALKKLQHYCAYQERCQYEVANKLLKLGIDKNLSDEIIAELIETNYLNEERFTRSVIRGKFRINHWGKIKIRQWLNAKHIYKNLIEFCMNEIGEEDYKNELKRLIDKELTKYHYEYSKKPNVFNSLLNKGFEADLIQNILDKVEWNLNTD